MRLVVPGIEKLIAAYTRDEKDFFAIQATLHPQWCSTKLEHLMYALQQDGEHKYGYDLETMQRLLRTAGFTRNRGIKDNRGGYLSLFVDAVK